LDAAGRLRNLTNPLGQKTLYTPDALDRITQLTDAINGPTALTYDANSNLLTVTDAKTQQTIYTYSNMNRTSTRKDPLLNTETYTYDNNGNVATVLDRKNQTTSYTYDPLNRKTKATYQDSTSTNYTYDAGNRVTTIQEKDSGGAVTATITRTYDGLDRLTNETTAQGSVTYVYDNASRRTSMTVAGQTAVTYTYDNANRLTQVQQGTSTVTLAYDNADRRTSLTLPNSNSVTSAYDAASQLTSLTYKKGVTVLGDLTYTYDAAGNRIKTGGAFAHTTIPPALSTVSYNANNQQTTFGTNTETYDLNGNLSTVTDAGVTATYTWNARNQLTTIATTGFAASFTYDSFGRRTGRTVQGVTTNFVYDGLNPVQEKAGATVTANLLTGLGIDEFFTRTDGVGSRALLPDALGSTVALGDGTGTLQTQYTYEPFGYATQTGQANSSSYKYTGREDDGTGLYYYRARYYHPRLQRFISEDPIGFQAGDVNIYAYTRNSATNWRDPLGLFTVGDYFDSDLTIQGLAAFADGLIPFWDPLASSGTYNACDPRLAYNRGIGILTRDLELGLTIGASSGALFGRGGILNQGPWRVGWGQKRGVGQVFRVGGPGNDIHFLDWYPFSAAAIGYGSMAGATLADLFLNGGQSCGCQQ
jgi:RHS repeat-associated protein